MNYRSIIISGIGSIGGALLTIGREQLEKFEAVLLVDQGREALRVPPDGRWGGIRCLQGDIQNRRFLRQALDSVPLPALLVNLCSDVDTVLLRQIIARLPVAYIDSGASLTPGEARMRFSRIMPYTNQACHGEYPHLICQGINPGLVEIIARRLMAEFSTAGENFEVLIFERDLLRTPASNGKVPVGWSPKDFVEEIMVSPSFSYHRGRDREGAERGTQHAQVQWNGNRHAARMVGHEDIWNLARIPAVDTARYLYSLDERVMQVLSSTPERALARLQVPAPEEPLVGTDTICVAVRGQASGYTRAMQWKVDHRELWQAFGINGVQYQTAKSILFAAVLLNRSGLGTCKGTYNATTLPIAPDFWPEIEGIMQELGMAWEELTFPEIPVHLC